MDRLAQYIIVNKGLDMSAGKIAAQASHAAVRGALSSSTDIRSDWLDNGETKIVLEARDETHLRNIKDYAAQCGVVIQLVIDEGRTEIPALSVTAGGSSVLNRDHKNVKLAFSTLRTYRDEKPVQNISLRNRIWFWFRLK